MNLPLPFPDALQEFKVETSSVPAQYGQHAAGAVEAITKSGTNEFHGTAFEFLRNAEFNARNVFALQRDGLKRNQFGGVIGGPIIKNKLFFFGGDQSTLVTLIPHRRKSRVHSHAADARRGLYDHHVDPMPRVAAQLEGPVREQQDQSRAVCGRGLGGRVCRN